MALEHIFSCFWAFAWKERGVLKLKLTALHGNACEYGTVEGELESAVLKRVVELRPFCKFTVSFVTDFCFVKDLQLE